jgi:hypothetical protein
LNKLSSLEMQEMSTATCVTRQPHRRLQITPSSSQPTADATGPHWTSRVILQIAASAEVLPHVHPVVVNGVSDSPARSDLNRFSRPTTPARPAKIPRSRGARDFVFRMLQELHRADRKLWSQVVKRRQLHSSPPGPLPSRFDHCFASLSSLA